MPTIFVTGTDTEVGKTRISCGLLRQLRANGLKVCGYKPVASGCETTPQGLRNEDALALQLAAQTSEDYGCINPYAFAPAIAPHLAAKAVGVNINITLLNQAHDELALSYDWVVTEGAGGFLVPLNDEITFGDWATQRGWPVMLVVGMRLGCINHALLSAEAIARRGLLAGWIANALSADMPQLQENIDTLKSRMPAPLLGLVNYGAEVRLDLETLQRRVTGSPVSP
ncbi:MAG: dethiobiotin synthase [Rhizobium sp.]|nr:MAG: dethiobiotin synthase [Rhizobium sp.]